MKKTNKPLHKDVLQEIFLRLPIKPLAQCKLLSKYWNNVISQPRFAVQGRSSLPNRTLLIHQHGAMIYPRHQGGDSVCGAVPWTWDSGMKYFSMAKIIVAVGAWDGLICFSAQTENYTVVWNPLLKNMHKCYFKHKGEGSYFFGFGFDDVNNEYKVIKIIQSKDETSVEIHNLHTKGSSVILFPSGHVSFQLTNAAPVTVHGCSHWIGVNLDDRKLELVRFDLGSEEFVSIPFPNSIPNIELHTDIDRIAGKKKGYMELEISGITFRLGVLKDLVCLFVSHPTKVDVWCLEYLKNYEDCTCSRIWNKEFEIELSHPRKSVIGFNANEELVIEFIDDLITAYNPWTKKMVSVIGRLYRSYQLVTYVETIVPVKPPKMY